MAHEPRDLDAKNPNQASAAGATRLQKAVEAATTRFGMEDGDHTEVPATGLDPEQQSPSE